jgi:hypothetical protein
VTDTLHEIKEELKDRDLEDDPRVEVVLPDGSVLAEQDEWAAERFPFCY